MYHQYHSADHGLIERDLIRCNPMAYGVERFDTVLIDAGDHSQVAKLHLIFEIEAFERLWQLARVTYFRPTSSVQADRVLGQKRFAAQNVGEFIHLASIVRSCYLSPVYDGTQDFYLNDMAAGDTDLYCRLNGVL
jgi:hypothetical protein